MITGASAGVGRATARRFASRGARIALLARGRDGLEATAREVEAAGGTPLVLQSDVSDAHVVEEAAQRAEAEFGPIDVWINNAMATVFARFLDVTPEEFRRATEVTYLGTVWGTLAALRRMAPLNRGTIVQVGSALAYRAIPLQAPYSGAKHAIQGFTESLRTELLHDGIDVHLTLVHLPAHNTPQFEWARSKLPRKPQPMPPIFQPEVAAEAIEYAARHPRREIYVAWPATKAILGERLAARVGDRVLARNGFESQQRPVPEDPTRLDNLFEPVPGDHGAHGPFDARSKRRSWLLWANLHRAWLGAAAGAVLVGASAGAARKSSRATILGRLND